MELRCITMKWATEIMHKLLYYVEFLVSWECININAGTGVTGVGVDRLTIR